MSKPMSVSPGWVISGKDPTAAELKEEPFNLPGELSPGKVLASHRLNASVLLQTRRLITLTPVLFFGRGSFCWMVLRGFPAAPHGGPLQETSRPFGRRSFAMDGSPWLGGTKPKPQDPGN